MIRANDAAPDVSTRQKRASSAKSESERVSWKMPDQSSSDCPNEENKDEEESKDEESRESKQKSRRKLRETIESNRESLTKLTKKK